MPDYNYLLEQAFYKTKADGLITLLQAAHVDLTGIIVSFNGQQYVFEAANQEATERFTKALQIFFKIQALPDLAINAIEIPALIKDAVAKSTCQDEKFKRACLSTYEIIEDSLQFNLQISKKHIEVDIDSPMKAVYQQMFARLEYRHMVINTTGQFVFDLHAYLNEQASKQVSEQTNVQAQAQSMLTVISQNEKALILLDDSYVQLKSIYTITTPNPANAQEVMVEHFFTPKEVKVPRRRFILDMSGSMSDPYQGQIKIDAVKESLLQFAQVSFALYPGAPLELHTFSSLMGPSLRVLRPEGLYYDYDSLHADLAELQPSGGTPLMDVTFELLEPILKEGARGINTLIFTDGEPTDMGHSYLCKDSNEFISGEQRLSNLLSSQQESEVIFAENKCYFICCGTVLPAILKQAHQLFDCEALPVETAQFTKAAGAEQLLAEFLKFRSILSCQAMVVDQAGDTDEQETTFRYHASGQLVAIPAITASAGERVSLVIRNADGEPIVNHTFHVPQRVEAAKPSSSSEAPQPTVSSNRLTHFGGSWQPVQSIQFVAGSTRVVTPIASSSSSQGYQP